MSLFALHVGCGPYAMTFDDSGACCGSCGLRWPLGRDRHGRLSEYRQPRKEAR